MELEGTVTNGLIVPDEPSELPLEGTRVTIRKAAPLPRVSEADEQDPSLNLYGMLSDLIVDWPEAPTDLAAQHDHYRLGTPKR